MKAEDTRQALSLRKRLGNLAQEWETSHHLIFRRYAIEGLLRRLSASPYGDMYVLKGAMLFAAWSSRPLRASQDVDFLNLNALDFDRDAKSFEDICKIDIEEDSLLFDSNSIKVTPIGGHQREGGMRIKTLARLGKTRIPLQMDVGYGDIVSPAVQLLEFPSLLFASGPVIKAYSKESVVAEKLEAIIALGWKNTRMKDFYDLFALSQLFEFDGETLATAIRATLHSRETKVLEWPPNGLSEAFAQDAERLARWEAFLQQASLMAVSPSLAQVVERIVQFAGPPLYADMCEQRFQGKWNSGGPWTD